MADGKDVPHLTLEEMEAHAQDLICLTGGPSGLLGRFIEAGQSNEAMSVLSRLQTTFDDRIYIELQRHPSEDGKLMQTEQAAERWFIETAYARNLPLVATNDVYFAHENLHEAHDALLCISESAYIDQQAPRRHMSSQHYLKTPEEMAILFADVPEALENTVEIARRCAFKVSKRAPILPRFAENELEELRREAKKGLSARLGVIDPVASPQVYQKRLEFELDVIEQMGFPGYFLIVADFIKWAKTRGIPVGPGRGSGAGSLVAYALTITDLDPLRYGLLFERFLNPERISMPDFDIDFCMERREEVIDYVQETYGRDRVAQIITFGALLSKAAIRDVARVLQIPYGQADRLSKMITVEAAKPVSLDKALADEPRFQEEAKADPLVERLLSYAQQLEGLLRNSSTHAAGVVIGDRPLDELVPLYKDPRATMATTQFNMKWVEAAGLVKFDFLGLKTLTVVENAVALIQKSGRTLAETIDGEVLYTPQEGAENDISQIPLDDPQTYQFLANGRTIAVFQLESTGMVNAIRNMKPTCIEDIVALVALYRPGPMENIPLYCDVKNNKKKRETIHPSIDHILDETQGIIVYQEQVMEIARQMAGYTLGQADLLRRAMGKKNQADMDKERPRFLAGAAKNDVDEATAETVWNLLHKFANYGFNKSHAAAYAIVSYQTAWLKVNHPAEFMAATMNSDLHQTDKLAVSFQEASKGMGLPWVPPCVNRSQALFDVQDGIIFYALGALKNVGVDAMRLIVEARGNQPFTTLLDFARRVDLKRVGKRALEMLARAGAFDILEPNRRLAFENLDRLMVYSVEIHNPKEGALGDLLGGIQAAEEPQLTAVQDWLSAERLEEEFTAIGFYLSGHPLDTYKYSLNRKGIITLQELTTRVENDGFAEGNLAGVVTRRKERKSARGNRFAFVKLSDATGAYEIMLFSETLQKARHLLESGTKVAIKVKAAIETDQTRLMGLSVVPLEEVLAHNGAKALTIYIDTPSAMPLVCNVLEAANTIKAKTTRGKINLCLVDNSLPAEVEILLPTDYPVVPPVQEALRALDGVAEVLEGE